MAIFQKVQVLLNGEIYNNVVGIIEDGHDTMIGGFMDCEEVKFVRSAVDTMHITKCIQVKFMNGMIVNKIGEAMAA